MIEMVYVSKFQFYNKAKNRMDFKKRPVLIVSKADSTDYVVLPISRVTNQANLDTYYDFKIDPVDMPLLNLTQISYVRTHKQSIVNKSNLIKGVVNFKKEYTKEYSTIIAKVKEFQDNIYEKEAQCLYS